MNINDPKILTAKKLHSDKTIPIEDICNTLNISRATLSQCLKINSKEQK